MNSLMWLLYESNYPLHQKVLIILGGAFAIFVLFPWMGRMRDRF